MAETKNPLAPFDEMEKACKNAYSNALSKCLDLNKIASYMFMAGVRFERERKIPESDFDKDTNF